MTDRTTKLLLALIALGLFANALLPLMRPTPARADQAYSCSGKMDASPLGTEFPGGYMVEMKCR